MFNVLCPRKDMHLSWECHFVSLDPDQEAFYLVRQGALCIEIALTTQRQNTGPAAPKSGDTEGAVYRCRKALVSDYQ